MNMTNQQPQQFSEEEGLASRQAIADILREENLPIETLAEIGNWAEAVINDPARFPEFQDWLRSQGLEESEIPAEPDMQELSSMVAIGNTAESMMEEQAGAQPESMPGAVAGPVSPEQMAQMADMGRNGDTQLAHINSEEAAMLKQMGGTGTINPATGLPEYGFFSKLWDGVKKIVKKVAPFVLPAVAIFVPALIPAIGTYLGASAALAPIVGSAVLAGGVTALSGGSAKDVLKSAALSGLGSYLTPVLGKYVGSAIGVTSPVLTNVIGSAAFAGGLTALRGGTVANILKDAATGGAASYLGQIASNAINSGKISNTKITQSAFDDASFAAADAEQLAKQGLSESQIKQTLQATGLSSTTAGTAAKLAASGTAAADIAVQLSNTAGSNKNLYTDKQTGVQNSVIGGGNVEALETVQSIEDARFIAEDVKQLKAQGLSNSQIKDNLIMAGVDPKVAGNIVNQSGSTVDTMVKNLTGSSAFKETGFFVKDFDPATAQRQLGTAPGAKVTTPTTTTPTTTTPTTTTPNNTQVFDDGSTLTTGPTGNVVKATNVDGSTYIPGSNPNLPVTTPTTTTPPPGEKTQVFDDGSTITTDANGNVVKSTNADGTPYVPGSNPNLPVNQTPPGEKTQIFDDGSTLTTDANGNVIRSTNSDGTPYVPGSNPNLPKNQTGEKTQIFDDGSTLTTDANGNVIRSTNSDGTPYVPGSNPNLPINQPTNPLLPPPTFIPPYVPPAPTTPTPVDPYAGPPGAYSFGTVTPPNTSQGINPGFMPGSVDYQTTSPVQAQFDWSKTAYQPGPEYNPALQKPAPAPFGLQQMYTPISPEQLLQLTQNANLYAGLLPTGTGR
jgi:SOS response regulatory protein OraA/RecX